MNHLSTLVSSSFPIQYHGNEPFFRINFPECEQMVAYFSSAVININKKNITTTNKETPDSIILIYILCYEYVFFMLPKFSVSKTDGMI